MLNDSIKTTISQFTGELKSTFFGHKSRCRRLQYDWLAQISKEVGPKARVLDLGGVKNAEYHRIVNASVENIIVWNLSPKTSPDELVNLDDIPSLPQFPENTDVVLLMNVLEHLYRPLDLLDWVGRGLPSGGKIIASTPFCYPVHESPNDYWRLTPQAYARFFEELGNKNGIHGQLSVTPLAEDWREAASLITTPLFFGKAPGRLAASLIEAAFSGGSKLVAALGGETRLKRWAQSNAPAIGVLWVKE